MIKAQLLAILGWLGMACGSPESAQIQESPQEKSPSMNEAEKPNEGKELETATFGAGCFWCVEAVFQRVNGVESVVSGYTGGKSKNPTYEQICTGTTGHAEVIQIQFDPAVVSYEFLLEVLWHTHDPTTLNKQGNDVGTQYRSAIFYHNDTQRSIAETSKKKTDASGLWNKPIVTTIEPITEFYAAEKYHQNYYNRNGQQPYCSFVIAPKVAKLHKLYKDKLKREYAD